MSSFSPRGKPPRTIRVLYVTPFAPSLRSGGGRHCYANLRSLLEYPGASVDYVGPPIDDGLPGLSDVEFGISRSRPFTIRDKVKAAFRGAATSLASVYEEFTRTNRGKEYDLSFVESTRCGFVFRDPRGEGVSLCCVHNVEVDYLRANQTGTSYLATMNVSRSERHTLRSCRTFLVMHEDDRRRLREVYGADAEGPRFIVHSVCSLPPRNPPLLFEKRTLGPCFVGSLDSRFNAEGLREFVATCWPLLRRAGHTLTVAGSHPSPDLVAFLARQGGIHLIADPPDMEPLLRNARMLVLPDMTGTGMKLRVAEAMSLGVPVVGTRMGLKGYENISLFGRMVEKVPEMGPVILEWDRDLLGLATISQSAVSLWKVKYSLDVFKARMHQVLDSLLPPEQRTATNP